MRIRRGGDFDEERFTPFRILEEESDRANARERAEVALRCLKELDDRGEGGVVQRYQPMFERYQLLFEAAGMYADLGDFDSGYPVARELVTLTHQTVKRAGTSMVNAYAILALYAFLAREEGRREQARDIALEIAEVYDEAEDVDRQQQAVNLMFIATDSASLGEWDEAIRYTEKAYECLHRGKKGPPTVFEMRILCWRRQYVVQRKKARKSVDKG